MLNVTQRDGTVQFTVRVQPRGRRNAVEGEWEGALKVRVTAPPVDDRANEACRRLLAEHLNIPVAAVRILSGERSRTKRGEVCGVTTEQVRRLVPGRQEPRRK